jgi:hypothetical protein
MIKAPTIGTLQATGSVIQANSLTSVTGGTVFQGQIENVGSIKAETIFLDANDVGEVHAKTQGCIYANSIQEVEQFNGLLASRGAEKLEIDTLYVTNQTLHTNLRNVHIKKLIISLSLKPSFDEIYKTLGWDFIKLWITFDNSSYDSIQYEQP